MCGCLSCAPYTHYWGPATQACTLTGNGTGDPLVHRPALDPLSHTSQGSNILNDMSMLSVMGTTEWEGGLG